jgi:GNAT superfamily N-acetyltransferase
VTDIREPAIAVDHLRETPDLAATVADRIWRAGWGPDGSSLADVEGALDKVMAAEGFPFTLVARQGHQFVGTVTSIQKDIRNRPELGPCLADLWVEPAARGQGVAQVLIEAVLTRLSSQGFSRVYLAAEPHLHAFYEAAGWSLVERDVGDDRIGVFVRALP